MPIVKLDSISSSATEPSTETSTNSPQERGVNVSKERKSKDMTPLSSTNSSEEKKARAKKSRDTSNTKEDEAARKLKIDQERDKGKELKLKRNSKVTDIERGE